MNLFGHSWKKSLVAGFLIVAVFTPHAYLLTVPQDEARAQTQTVVEVGANLIQNTLSLAKLALIELKEFVLDGIAFTIAKAIIREMTASIVRWINSGFQGSPLFVEDIGRFFTSVADRVIGDFIEGSSLSFLCSPFSLQVKLSLAFNFRNNQRLCTLTRVVSNVEGFLSDFTQGGWPAWFQLTTQSVNNPYGSYLIGLSEINLAISNSISSRRLDIQVGKGFLPFQKCDTIYDPGGLTGEKPVKTCKTVTPGAVIEDGLADVLGSGIRQLELADEFNEIISALVLQLIKQVFGGSGITGLTQRSNGQPSFITQFASDTSADRQIIANLRGPAVEELNRNTSNETRFRNFKENTLSSVLNAELAVRELRTCYADKLAQGTLSGPNQQVAQERLEQASTTLSSILKIKQPLEVGIAQADRNLGDLLRLLGVFEDEDSTVGEVQQAGEELATLIRGGRLHTLVDVQSAEQENDARDDEMGVIIAETKTKIAECQAFPNNNP